LRNLLSCETLWPDLKPVTGPITTDWILRARPPRNTVDPSRPYAFTWERERAASGEVVDVATLFLTNRECPWKCLMCDLWKNTTETGVPAGAIPGQIDFALSRLEERTTERQQIKLYNSGSFFDARAVPPADHRRIAEQVRHFDRVVVECHPALIDDRVPAFRDLLGNVRLEVAMGLETTDPDVLPRLNKGVTLDAFRRAADFLVSHGIDLRTFVLVKTPWQSDEAALEWAVRSARFSAECGATVVALIPTRLGNGALETLAGRGEFSPPKLTTLERAFERCLVQAEEHRPRPRIFVDLWDLGQFSDCRHCVDARKQRLEAMNLEQRIKPGATCGACGE